MLDKAKRFHIYNRMTKQELIKKSLELSDVAIALLEWIDAVPGDVVLPAMPGIDRDWIDNVI